MNGLSKLGDIITTVAAFAFSLACDTKDEKGKDISDKICLKQKYAIMYFISGICCCLSSLLLFFETKDKFIYENEILNAETLINAEEIIQMKKILN